MSLERGDGWIGKLLDDFSSAKVSKKPNDKMIAESVLYKKLLCLRNGINENDIQGDNYKEGHYFTVKSSFQINEDKFSQLYNDIFNINKYGVNDDVITLHDEKLKRIIKHNNELPMWHEITDKQSMETATPLFRYKSKENFQKELIERYNDITVKNSKFAEIEKDREITVRNDKFPPTCTRKISLSKQLQLRINNETDPQYKSHPSEYMLINIIAIKSKDMNYFDYGLRFIELYMNDIMSNSEKENLLHLPIEFKTDGSYIGMQYDTLFIQQFRYAINLLALKVHNVMLGVLSEEYRKTSDEILIYMLEYPYLKGKKFKTAFTPIGLYYNMDAKLDKTQSGIYMHRHPYYNVSESILNDYPYTFSNHTVCTGEKCANNFKTGVYSHSVIDFVNTFFTYADESNLNETKKFVKKRLLPVRPNAGAPKDLIFIRMHIGAGGYSHTHKLADFIPDIEKHYEQNEKFSEDKKLENEDARKLIEQLKIVGYEQTLNLIRKGSYPRAEIFKVMLPSFLTSRSAGIAPITLEMKLKMGKTKVETIKQNMTSKTAHAALRGENVFNIPMYVGNDLIEVTDDDGVVIRYDLKEPIEYYNSLSNDEKLRVQENGLDTTDLAKMNVSTIGSRATSGYRAIRAIFMVKLHQHLMQCALVQPHVSITTSRYSNNNPPKSLWINSDDYGRSILTTDQDGSNDVWARYAMASGDGRMILSAADASAWDQNVKNGFLEAYYAGIEKAILERAIMDDGTYMSKDGHGLSLREICAEFMKIQMKSLYIAEYGWEAAIVRVNFLTSGRLDTFMFNSIMNSEINKIINDKLRKLEVPASYVALTVAGDDMLSVLKTDANKANEIEIIKNVEVETYNNCGQNMNLLKTVLARYQAEVAKRNFYFGQIFRDPNVQFFESEKSDKAENRLTRIRGQGSKQFEAIRRSVADIELSMMTIRLGVMLMYSFKYLPKIPGNNYKTDKKNDKKGRKDKKDKADSFEENVSVKYYPPYALSIMPTHVSGGLGISFTGISINEVKFMLEEDMSIVDDALAVASMIKNTSTQGVQNAFLKQYIPKSKYGIIAGSANDRVQLVEEPKFTNVNPTDAKPSIESGMALVRKSLKVQNLLASDAAIKALSKADIVVQESVKYANGPELLIRNMAESISLRYNRGKKDVDEVIRSLFYVDIEGKVRMVEIKKHMTLASLYPIYTMFVCKVNKDENGDIIVSNGVSRVVSQALRFSHMEIYYGARHGKNARLNLQGANTKLRQFISQAGLPMTAEQLNEHIINAGVLDDTNKLYENLLNYLVAVSGDIAASEAYIQEASKDTFVWEDMLTAVTIAGSSTEEFDWSSDTVMAKSRIQSNTPIPINVANMIRYTTYMYMLQRSCYYNEYYASCISKMVTGYQRTLQKMRPKSSRHANISAFTNDLISTMAEFYNRNKEACESYQALIRDEMSEY